MSYTLRYVRGHVEVYSLSGAFLCSADSAAEAHSIMEDET